MPLKIFLTADVHLGLKYGSYPAIQQELAQARFSTLKNLVQKANEEHCELFVVAGDLFDNLRVADRDVILAAKILQEFQGRLVAVLPGNHDFIVAGESRLWQKFKTNSGDRTLLLEEQKVYPLQHYDIDANLYAAPCGSKHAVTNAVGWIDQEPRDEGVMHHLGVAHGSLAGLSPDPDMKYFPMTEEELRRKKLDIWLLGHTDRMQYPKTSGSFDQIFYPATPEPNGFNCLHEGKAWILELNENKSVTSSSLSTGHYKFTSESREISGPADLESLLAAYADPAFKNVLLQLELIGMLPAEEFGLLGEFERQMKECLFHFELGTSMLIPAITSSAIDREFTLDSFPHRLLKSFGDEEADKEALQIAYELLREMKP